MEITDEALNRLLNRIYEKMDERDGIKKINVGLLEACEETLNDITNFEFVTEDTKYKLEQATKNAKGE